MSGDSVIVDKLAALETEIELISASLLPAESLTSSARDVFPQTVEISSSESSLRLHVDISHTYPRRDSVLVEVKGEHVGREEAVSWRSRMDGMMQDWDEASDTPLYSIMSTQFLPLLAADAAPPAPSDSKAHRPVADAIPHHALITTHHLLSPTKRKLLQQLSSELNLVGFSKTGHPGILYATGDKEDIDEWLIQVRSWNWLALRLRIACEPSPSGVHSAGKDTRGEAEQKDSTPSTQSKDSVKARGEWEELEKVSEALDWMKLRGREKLLVDAGVGSMRDS